MKDMIYGIKALVTLTVVILAFESSTTWGVVSLIGVAILLYASVKKKLYTENPQLRPWIDFEKFEKEDEQIANKSEENYCDNCGIETPKNSRFCINCGSKNLK